MQQISWLSPQSARPVLRLALLLPALYGCEVIHGSGHLVEEERDMTKFDRVVVEGEAEVEFVQDEERSVVVEAEDNIIDRVVTKVENGALVLGTKGDAILDPTLPIAIRVSGPDLGQISLQGSGSFACETLSSDELGVHVGGSGAIRIESLTSDTLSLQMSGSGEIAIGDLDGEDVEVEMTGSGGISVAGDADTQQIHLAGTGSYLASSLKTDDIAVDLDGSGDVEVFAERSLNVNIDGSGNVLFKGDASVSTLISGTGSVIPSN